MSYRSRRRLREHELTLDHAAAQELPAFVRVEYLHTPEELLEAMVNAVTQVFCEQIPPEHHKSIGAVVRACAGEVEEFVKARADVDADEAV